jgi:hypothetical protein
MRKRKKRLKNGVEREGLNSPYKIADYVSGKRKIDNCFLPNQSKKLGVKNKWLGVKFRYMKKSLTVLPTNQLLQQV